MDLSKINYSLYDDIMFFASATETSLELLSDKIGISKLTLQNIKNGKSTTKDVLEKIYSYIYANNYRLNKVKEEFFKEEYEKVLFHGSKKGLGLINYSGSRSNCDFGNGFYLGELYDSALSFVSSFSDSSIYSFKFRNTNDLQIVRFKTDIEWMLAICYFRGTIKKYENHPRIISIINKINDADLIIAPIADNKMFNIMNAFANVDINQDVALHSLSASQLGLQYVFRTEKALNELEILERHYICEAEKAEAIKQTNNRSMEIETKLKLAKMKYKNGLFIEELFNEGI